MSDINEQDPRAIAMQYRELQKRAEMLQQQMNMIRVSVGDCSKALSTIEVLSTVNEGTEVKVPIGSGSFVYANIARVDTVLVDIGAGISVERSLADAKEFMEGRREKLEKAFENMAEAVNRIAQQIQSIEAYISRQQQSQARPQSPG